MLGWCFDCLCSFEWYLGNIDKVMFILVMLMKYGGGIVVWIKVIMWKSL